jgi:hypothetical protein
VYRWRNSNPAFKEAMEDAVESGTDALVDVAMQRAVDGSDALLTLLLKGRRPSVFRERMEASVAVSGPIEFTWGPDGARPDIMHNRPEAGGHSGS